jgi:regulatory protein
MLRKGFAPDEVGPALERMEELGYLDESAFAEALVRRRSGTRGRAAIAAELAAKGLGRLAVQEALTSMDDEAQVAAATGLGRRLMPKLPRPGDDGLAKVAAKLQRRGFPNQVVREACRNLAAELMAI